mmetsp:Transcript_38635/g.49954  ORF Transcript_38635/g.49954 Transcript_38635/m.49954 type:complete len:161 (+) Transcript_38635:113-595(+)
MELYHHRMGHCSDAALVKLSTMAQGMPNLSSTERPFCADCPIGRMQRLSKNKSGTHRASGPLQLKHCDLKGPVNPATPSGQRYLCIYVHDFSGSIYPFLLKNKTDQRANFNQFKLHVEKLFGTQVQEMVFFRTDGAKEFGNPASYLAPWYCSSSQSSCST